MNSGNPNPYGDRENLYRSQDSSYSPHPSSNRRSTPAPPSRRGSIGPQDSSQGPSPVPESPHSRAKWWGSKCGPLGPGGLGAQEFPIPQESSTPRGERRMSQGRHASEPRGPSANYERQGVPYERRAEADAQASPVPRGFSSSEGERRRHASTPVPPPTGHHERWEGFYRWPVDAEHQGTPLSWEESRAGLGKHAPTFWAPPEGSRERRESFSYDSEREGGSPISPCSRPRRCPRRSGHPQYSSPSPAPGPPPFSSPPARASDHGRRRSVSNFDLSYGVSGMSLCEEPREYMVEEEGTSPSEGQKLLCDKPYVEGDEPSSGSVPREAPRTPRHRPQVEGEEYYRGGAPHGSPRTSRSGRRHSHRRSSQGPCVVSISGGGIAPEDVTVTETETSQGGKKVVITLK